jgi:RimJ/RimL family protein N-acetyltransferase
MIDACIIITDRLFLRPVEFGDAAGAAALMSPEISSNLHSWPARISADEVSERIGVSRRATADGRWVDWGVFLKDDLNFIGWVGAGKCDGTGTSVRIGYWLGDIFQQQRYGTEAVTAIVTRAQDIFGADAMDALVAPSNVASIRILARLGFAPQGIESCYSPVRGRTEEYLRFAKDLVTDGIACTGKCVSLA